MMDPISQLALVVGEAVVVTSPPVAGAYDPNAATDYVPPADASRGYKGIPADPDERLSEGATAAVTLSTATMPAGLQAGETRVAWRGRPWGVVSFRERYYRGVLNGVTLHLGA